MRSVGRYFRREAFGGERRETKDAEPARQRPEATSAQSDEALLALELAA
jgi:hypothetical protein